MSDPHDPAWFRKVLGHYPTGVSVVTGVEPEGGPTGLVVGTFTSVSLDPPVVAFFPDKSSTSWPKIKPSKHFCVNILAADQGAISAAFARKGGDKFDGISWRPGDSGSPIIDDVVAWVECKVAGVHEVGDHELVLGRVLALDVERPSEPLLFHGGGFGSFAPHA